MKKGWFPDTQIVYAVQHVERGIPVGDVCRKYGIRGATRYRWRTLYCRLAPSELRYLKQFEAENRKLECLVAELPLDRQSLQDVVSKRG